MNPKWWIMALLAAGCNADVGGTTAYVALIGGSCTYPAKRMAAEIFQKAGVTIIWGSPREAASRSGWLRVRIVEPAPGDVLPGALAVAHPYSACSKSVTVFIDRIRSRTRRPDHETALLAYVLAHEIAHVIQGVHRHSQEGVMKARWSAGDYAAIFDRRLGFVEEDLLLMRQGLAVGWCHKPGELIGRSESQNASRPE